MSDEQINEIGRKLREIDKDLYLSFVRAENKDSWISQNAGNLEEDSWFTDNYKNIADFTGDRNKAIADLYRDLDGATPTKARLHSFTKKHPDISEQEVLDWFKKTNDIKLEEIARREDEADKIRRAREVREEWNLLDHPIRALAASEYEKERYINEPWNATIGKEAAGFIGSSIPSKLDVISGTAAAGADLVPGAGSVFAGPAIRFGRDLAHKAPGSTYQKDWGTLLSDAGKDVAMNATAFGLANTRKLARVARGFMSDNAKTAMTVDDLVSNTKQGLNDLDKLSKMEGAFYDPVQFRRMVEYGIPEGPMKEELKTASKDWITGDIDWNAVRDIRERYAAQVATEDPVSVARAAQTAAEEGYKVNGATPVLEARILRPELTKPEKIGISILRGIEAVNTGKPGQMVYQQIPNVSGKRSSPVEGATQAMTFDQAKKWYKEKYKDDWRKNEFTAINMIEDDPAMLEAYKEVMAEEEAKREGREAQYKRFKNLGGNI